MRDLKNTAEFTRMVEAADGPVTVTRNGRDALVVMTSAQYEQQQLELSRARLIERMARAEEEYKAGDYVDGDAFVAALKDEYAL